MKLLCLLLLVLTGCTSKQEPPKILSELQEINMYLTEPLATLDPRITQGIASSNVIYMLFEGLTKVDQTGKVIPACADSINISPDMKSYTFGLKNSKWSNGEPVRAQDFVYSWQFKNRTKSVVSNVQALDDKTLKVDLKQPTPYFLQMCATATFFPVQQRWTHEHPDFTENGVPACVSNGPFALAAYKKNESIELKKNEFYWSALSVKIQLVRFSFLNESAAIRAFQERALDWIGNPFSNLSQNDIQKFQDLHTLSSSAAAGCALLYVNVTQSPFNISRMRHAFASCLDLQKIIDTAMDKDERVAQSIIPPILGLPTKPYFEINNFHIALSLFEEALQEAKLTRENLPPIRLCYVPSARTNSIAAVIQSSIQEAFNIDVELIAEEPKAFSQRLLNKEYTLALGSWFADYLDPMSFLSVFETKNNITGWSNATYTSYLEESCLEMDPETRKVLLERAVDTLMSELPVLPLFYYSFTYAKQDDLQGELLSPLGIVDLDTAFKVKIGQQT